MSFMEALKGGFVDISPELALKMHETGGFLVCQGMATGMVFGTDKKEYTVGPNFLGVKLMPLGIHYFYARVSENSPQVSFFHCFTPEDKILQRKWKAEDEQFEAPGVLDKEQLNRLQMNLQNIDRNLGAYDFNTYRTWQLLSSYIDERTLLRLTPRNDGGFIYSQIQATTMESEVDKNRPEGTQSYQVVDREHPTRLRFSDDHGLPKMVEKEGGKIRFTRIPVITFEMTLKKRSGADGSDRLREFIKICGGDRQFLAELQYAFITFYLGWVHDGYEQWKRMIHLICSCQDALKSHDALFSAFLATLHFQMKCFGDDFFRDELSKSNFLQYTLANLFANIQDSDTAPEELKSRARKMKILIEKKFDVAFEIVEEDPTIVELLDE